MHAAQSVQPSEQRVQNGKHAGERGRVNCQRVADLQPGLGLNVNAGGQGIFLNKLAARLNNVAH